ncbi:MAG: hypothetical protein UH854_00640 [Clostridia bacterium]|nr:hypothetical protein [Clostridia bacterium]
MICNFSLLFSAGHDEVDNNDFTLVFEFSVSFSVAQGLHISIDAVK